MPVPDVTEVWSALIDGLRADTDLVALLASATAVYREYPEDLPPLPSLILEPQHLEESGSTAIGLYRADVQFNVYSTDSDDGAKVYAHLEALWQIPTQRDQLTTTNFRVTNLQFSKPRFLGPAKMRGEESPVHHTVIESRIRISRRKTV